MRNWRNENPLTQEQKDKDNARSHVSLSIRRGMIKRGLCAYCKTDKEIQSHHQDYSKPLLMVWLCKTHHHQVTIGELKDDFIPTDYSKRTNRDNYKQKYSTEQRNNYVKSES